MLQNTLVKGISVNSTLPKTIPIKINKNLLESLKSGKLVLITVGEGIEIKLDQEVCYA